jgi:hypothetical protein
VIVGVLNALANAAVTVAVGPGILSHEYAHVFACRLTGVEIRQRPSLALFESAATFEHEPVETFVQDYAIAVAPLVVNSALALLSFVVMARLDPPSAFVPLWLGLAFGLTALPSDQDTSSLLPGAGTLSPASRPLGYALAIPLRAITISVILGGLLALGLTGALLALATGQ